MAVPQLPAPITVEFSRSGSAFVAADNSHAITFDHVPQILDILTKGGSNTVEVQGGVASSRDELLGCRVSVVVGHADTQIKF